MTLPEAPDFARILSPRRLGTYLAAARYDSQFAMDLYIWNAQVSGAFILPLQLWEVAIRNAVAEVLTCVYDHNWAWVDTFIVGLPDPRSGISLKRELLTTREKIRDRDTNKVIPELKLAWWIQMFTSRFDERLWEPHLRSAFSNMPTHLSPQECRNLIFRELQQVRVFRNRIAHHEPIFHRDLHSDYDRIAKILSWRCAKTARWLNEVQSVSMLLAQKPMRAVAEEHELSGVPV